MWTGGENLCRHAVPGSSEIRKHLFIPLAPLADWFVRSFPFLEFEERPALFPILQDLHESADRWGTAPPRRGLDEDHWLDAREQWWSRHFLRAGADGARVPNLAFSRANERLVLNWAPPRFFGHDAPRVLSPQGEFTLAWHTGQGVIGEFVGQVAVWLRECGSADTYPWAKEQVPLQTAKPALKHAIEYFTGRPVDELEALFGVRDFRTLLKTLGLTSSSKDPAASLQCQVLRDLSPGLSRDVGQLLMDIESLVSTSSLPTRDGWQTARSIAQDAARAAGTPEEAGQLAATELRRQLGVDGQPIGPVKELLTALGVAYEHARVGSQYDRMVMAAREGSPAIVRTLQSPRTETPWGQRFEACRGLGHLLLDPIRGGVVGAASGPFTQETRRRHSGAFAAELLLPESALAAASNDQLDGAAEDDAFKALLDSYEVGARTAAFQLWNRGWLSSPVVRDQLIDRFASVAPG